MNTSVNLLWGLVILSTIILIVLASLYMIRWSEELNISVFSSSNKCVVSADSVPDITNDLCCYVGTEPTASRYVPSINIVVNPVAIPYLPVCQGFCTEGFYADGLTCVDGVGQSEFNRCMQIATPIDCEGLSLPVAYAGSTPYYVFAATESSCPIKGPC